MKKLFLIFISLIFLVGCTSNAQTKVHPIDKAEEACIAKTADTQAMNKCSDIVQKAWEIYRNSEFQAINKMLADK